MKIFISWSGDLSRRIAGDMKWFVKKLFANIDVYVSSDDIEKGTLWDHSLAQELSKISYGILCVTAENRNSLWISFEAGAISKARRIARVCPFLVDIKDTDLEGTHPLMRFQATAYSEDDVLRLVMDMNRSQKGKKYSDRTLKERFDKWWPVLKRKIDRNIADVTEARSSQGIEAAPRRDMHEMVGEVLGLMRSQQRILSAAFPWSLSPLEKAFQGTTISFYNHAMGIRPPKEGVPTLEDIARTLRTVLRECTDKAAGRTEDERGPAASDG